MFCGYWSGVEFRVEFHTKLHSALIAAERTTTHMELETTHNTKPAPPTHTQHVHIRFIYIYNHAHVDKNKCIVYTRGYNNTRTDAYIPGLGSLR